MWGCQPRSTRFIAGHVSTYAQYCFYNAHPVTLQTADFTNSSLVRIHRHRQMIRMMIIIISPSAGRTCTAVAPGVAAALAAWRAVASVGAAAAAAGAPAPGSAWRAWNNRTAAHGVSDRTAVHGASNIITE